MMFLRWSLTYVCFVFFYLAFKDFYVKQTATLYMRQFMINSQSKKSCDNSSTFFLFGLSNHLRCSKIVLYSCDKKSRLFSGENFSWLNMIIPDFHQISIYLFGDFLENISRIRIIWFVRRLLIALDSSSCQSCLGNISCFVSFSIVRFSIGYFKINSFVVEVNHFLVKSTIVKVITEGWNTKSKPNPIRKEKGLTLM